MALKSLIRIHELKDERARWREAGEKVAFVPTMGALHEGHLSLVDQAKALADRVVVSIFVNPTQFGPNEDFARYPRTLQEDARLLEGRGVDALFLPNASDIYPEGFQTFVVNEVMAAGLCGASRPGHFRGVLTVVLKLLNLVEPHVAIFGKKDYQQWRLIERMARDFALPVEILGGAIMREADGLAMSSRNRYLEPAERKKATIISAALRAADEAYRAGERDPDALKEAFAEVLAREPDVRTEYVELRDQRDLKEPSAPIEVPVVMLAACRLGSVRLIDNLELGQSS